LASWPIESKAKSGHSKLSSKAIFQLSYVRGNKDLKQSYVSIFLLCLFCLGCGDYNLRGKFSKSADGKTYLAVIDDNGGHCGPLTVDGKKWEKPINRPREIVPGRHVIKCGGQIGFDVPAGVVYKFGYWGP
jgi:hypothetical protein